MKNKLLSFVFAATVAICFSGAANAAEPRLIGQHNDWNAYVFWEDGQKVCFMASSPIKSEGNYTRRGDVFALITHRPAENAKNVISFEQGYPLKVGSTVSAKIGSNAFKLFTKGENAWTPDAATDDEMTKGIQQGSKMIVKGTSTRGTLTTDTYSLSGSMAAYDAITKECGIK